MKRALTALGTLAAGAVAMYFSDPDQGRRRRAALQRTALAAARETTAAADALAKQARDRLHDLTDEGRAAGQQTLHRLQDLADVGRTAGQQTLHRLQDLAGEGQAAGQRALHRLGDLAREGRDRLAARRLEREPRPQRPVVSGRALLAALGGVAVGAAAMFLLDPKQRRRRLALARDQALRLGRSGAGFVDVGLRDLGHRAQGLAAQATGLMRRVDADDAVLVQRVRAAMGRVVSHPHAVEVSAAGGCITVAGPVLASERAALLKCVRSVRGVGEVRDALQPHESAAQVPALQGGRPRHGPHAELMPAHWAPGPRLLALAGGTALTLYGASRGGLPGLLGAAAGLGLTVRAARNEALSRTVARLTDRHGSRVDESTPAAAPQEAGAAAPAWRPAEATPGGAALH